MQVYNIVIYLRIISIFLRFLWLQYVELDCKCSPTVNPRRPSKKTGTFLGRTTSTPVGENVCMFHSEGEPRHRIWAWAHVSKSTCSHLKSHFLYLKMRKNTTCSRKYRGYFERSK
jgi:hypothetical protein